MIEANDAASWLLRMWRSFTERLYARQAMQAHDVPLDNAFNQVMRWETLPGKPGYRDQLIRKALAYSSARTRLRSELMNQLAHLAATNRMPGRARLDRKLMRYLPEEMNSEQVHVILHGRSAWELNRLFAEHGFWPQAKARANYVDVGMHPWLAGHVTDLLQEQYDAHQTDHIHAMLLRDTLASFRVALEGR